MNKIAVSDRIQLLKEPTNINMIRKLKSETKHFFRKSQFVDNPLSLKNQYGFNEGKSQLSSLSIYSIDKSYTSLQEVIRKNSQPNESEENVQEVDELYSQEINSIKPMFKKELDISILKDLEIQKQKEDIDQQVISSSMAAQFPHYPQKDFGNRDSNGSNSQKYKRRAMSADRYSAIQIIHRKKDIDSNEFEGYYLNIIKMAHQECKGNLEQLKKVFFQNSQQRRQSMGIVKIIHNSIINGQSTNSLSLIFNNLSNEQPFDIVQQPEIMDENFDLKSDYCIDYQQSGDSKSDTWNSLKEILDDSRLKIGEYKDFFIKEPSRLNRSKNQSIYQDVVRKELKVHTPKAATSHDDINNISPLQNPEQNNEQRFQKNMMHPQFLDNQEQYKVNILNALQKQEESKNKSFLEGRQSIQVQIVQIQNNGEFQMQGKRAVIGQKSAFSTFKKPQQK